MSTIKSVSRAHSYQEIVDVEMADFYAEDSSLSYEAIRGEKLQYIKDMYLILNATDGGLKELLELNEADQEMMLDWLDGQRALQPEESRSMFERALDAELQDQQIKVAVPKARLKVFRHKHIPAKWMAVKERSDALAAARFETVVKAVERGVLGCKE